MPPLGPVGEGTRSSSTPSSVRRRDVARSRLTGPGSGAAPARSALRPPAPPRLSSALSGYRPGVTTISVHVAVACFVAWDAEAEWRWPPSSVRMEAKAAWGSDGSGVSSKCWKRPLRGGGGGERVWV